MLARVMPFSNPSWQSVGDTKTPLLSLLSYRQDLCMSLPLPLPAWTSVPGQ